MLTNRTNANAPKEKEGKWLHFKSYYAVGGIELKNNKVISAPPIWKKWIGIDFEEFKKKFTWCEWSVLAEPPEMDREEKS